MFLDRSSSLIVRRKKKCTWTKLPASSRLRDWHKRLVRTAPVKRPLKCQLRAGLVKALGLSDAWVELRPDSTLWHISTQKPLRIYDQND